MRESCSEAPDISWAEEATACVIPLTLSAAFETCRAFSACCAVSRDMLWLISLIFLTASENSFTD